MFGDGGGVPWWDESNADDVSDDVRRILEERIGDISDYDLSAEELEELAEEGEKEELQEELGEEEIEEIEEEAEEESDEDERPEFEDIESAIEAHEDDEHLAPNNEIGEDWELAHHFDDLEDAFNYVAGVHPDVLQIVINDDGSADVYRDPDYAEASV